MSRTVSDTEKADAGWGSGYSWEETIYTESSERVPPASPANPLCRNVYPRRREKTRYPVVIGLATSFQGETEGNPAPISHNRQICPAALGSLLHNSEKPPRTFGPG